MSEKKNIPPEFAAKIQEWFKLESELSIPKILELEYTDLISKAKEPPIKPNPITAIFIFCIFLLLQ